MVAKIKVSSTVHCRTIQNFDPIRVNTQIIITDIPSHAAIFTTGPSFVSDINTVRWKTEAMVSMVWKENEGISSNPSDMYEQQQLVRNPESTVPRFCYACRMPRASAVIPSHQNPGMGGGGLLPTQHRRKMQVMKAIAIRNETRE